MRSSINLVESKSDGKKQIFTRLSVLRVIAIGLLFCVSLASVVLFIFIAQSPLPQLQIEERSIAAILSAQQTDLAKIILVNERAKTASELLTKRQAYDVMLDKIRSKMPSGLKVTSFTVSNNNVSLTVASRSLAALDQFINHLTDATGEQKEFTRVLLSDLSIDNDSYSMKVDIIVL